MWWPHFKLKFLFNIKNGKINPWDILRKLSTSGQIFSLWTSLQSYLILLRKTISLTICKENDLLWQQKPVSQCIVNKMENKSCPLPFTLQGNV